MFGPNPAKSQFKSVLVLEGSRKLTKTTVSVARIDAVQAEYSAFETIHETDDLIAATRELGVAYV